MSNVDWVGRFKKDFIENYGQSLLLTGYTGSGKTTKMDWILDGIAAYGQETIVWFDTMKSDEALTLLAIKPCRFLIPRGCKLEININPSCPYKVNEHEIVEMADPNNPWAYIRKGWINVVCIAAYIIEPAVYAQVVADIFTKLIRLSHHKQIEVPLAIFIDEFHNLAPANGHALSRKHNQAGLYIQMNVERLRSLGIRIIGSTQHMSKLRRGVRSSFNWLIVNRGTTFYHQEEPKLYQFNQLWSTLDNKSMFIVWPTRVYSDVITVDYYPRGSDIGTMTYIGELTPNA